MTVRTELVHSSANDAWYAIKNVGEIASPQLVVYPDRVQENIRRMIVAAGGTARLRPHVKTHKSADITRMKLAAGIDKFKCATIAEAEMLAACGAADVLWAFQPVGPNCERLARLMAAYPGTRFSTIADDAAAISRLSEVMAAANRPLEVLVDLDVGMRRTGVAPGPKAVELYRQIASAPGLAPGGLHIYDGHLRSRDLEARRREVDEAFRPVAALRVELQSIGLAVPRVVIGGSPSFPIHAQREDVECSPGTCVLWDRSYETKLPEQQYLNAAMLVTRVVSKPGADLLCLDLGYKAVSPDIPDPRVWFPDLPDAEMVVHSEEHLVVRAARADAFAVGDVLYGVPFHVCPTTALYRDLVVVRDGEAIARWPVTARDRMLAI